MQFERLRKSHKKQIVIGALVICIIGGALTFATTKAKYKLTESIDLVKGTINYKPYDFKIMAMYKSEDKTNYTEINEMPSEGYVINEEKTYCTTDNKNKVKGKIKTINGNVAISNLSKSDKCYLYFDKEKTASEKIIASLGTTIKTTIPDFTQAAESDEGIYKVADGMYGGYSYYWRGAVTNNYVKFAEKCWRIIRINGDGSIRLIYDGSSCHANGESTTDNVAGAYQTYNSTFNGNEYVGWTYDIGNQRPSNLTTGTSSNAKNQTDTWYNSNLKSYENKIAKGKFCNDRNAGSGYSWSSNPSGYFYYAGYDRSGAKNASNVTPTFSCPSEDVYAINVGAITMDEVVMAGGKWETSNNSYYLYNGQHYWTITPSHWYDKNSYRKGARVFQIFASGDLTSPIVNATNINVRPVINLRSDITFSTGNGTESNPYVVK